MEIEKMLKKSEEKLVLLSVLSDWSGASHIQGIYLDQLAQELAEDLELIKLDQNKMDSKDLDFFNVNKIPTSMVFKDRKVVGFWEGLTAKSKMRTLIDEQLY